MNTLTQVDTSTTQTVDAVERDIYLVLPALNEEAALPLLLARVQALREELKQRALSSAVRVILVDDGSSDGTAAVGEMWSRRSSLAIVRHEVNQGLGAAVRAGMLAALQRAQPDDLIVTMDADNTQPPALIESMLERIDAGADLAIASRYQPGARVEGLSRFRRLLSDTASWVFRLALPIPGVRDYTCGFRGYRAGLLQQVVARHGDTFCSRRGFECMVDLLLSAHAEGARCVEVPLVLRYDQKRGASEMPVARTIANTLRLLLSWRRRLRQQAAVVAGKSCDSPPGGVER